MFLDCFISNNRLFSQTSKAEVSFNVSEIITNVIILFPLVPNSIYCYFCVQSSNSFSLIIYNLIVTIAPLCFVPTNNGTIDRKPAREWTITHKIWGYDWEESFELKKTSSARPDCQESETECWRQGLPSLLPLAGSKTNVLRGQKKMIGSSKHQMC